MKAQLPLAAALPVFIALGAAATAARALDPNLADLSFEELANISVISSSKRAVRLADAPSSVFVITAEDIRRSGATSIPEALRLAPNLQVARISAVGYAVSARGFNGTAANKLLVLIDGRSVYSPLFSGVFWDVQDVMLEDVERIEVVSGAGGTLWGVNAVDGVINIITRPASETQGTLASGGAGNREEHAAVRYGAGYGSQASYRLYATQSDFAHTTIATGANANDADQRHQAGFRADWAADRDSLMVKGDLYAGIEGQPLPGSISITGDTLTLGNIATRGGNLTGLWERQLDGGGAVSLQLYYDHTGRTVPPTFADNQDIVDVQFQVSAAPWGANAIVWGAGYRYGIDHVDNSIYVALLPATLDQKWSNAFAQDEITLSDALKLTLGARLERNDYTGNEFLPTARLAWKSALDQLLWISASRTVRAPSRLDHDIYVPYAPGLPPPDLLRGGPAVVSELADDYEAGYRGNLGELATVSATLYRTGYDHLRTQEIDPSFTYVTYGNGMRGATMGAEAWVVMQAAPAWRINAGLSRLRQDLQLQPGSNDLTAPARTAGANPDLWWILRSSHDIGRRTELDLSVRHVAALAEPAVPGYTTLDLRLGWQALPSLELSLSGQNLLGGGHAEFTSSQTRSVIRPEAYVKAVWHP